MPTRPGRAILFGLLASAGCGGKSLEGASHSGATSGSASAGGTASGVAAGGATSGTSTAGAVVALSATGATSDAAAMSVSLTMSDAAAMSGAPATSDAATPTDASLDAEAGATADDASIDSAPQDVTPSPDGPASSCVAMRVVYDDSSRRIYWSNLGQGTISSMLAAGGPVTTVVQGQHIAATQINLGTGEYLPLQDDGAEQPTPTPLLVFDGTVYWVGAADSVTVDDAGSPHGGFGNTILSATAGGPPKTVVGAATVPAPSPVSALPDGGGSEISGQPPPIQAMALSPDGSTLYFAAGTRFYSTQSSGGGPVTYVGYSRGPEVSWPTVLLADATYLYSVGGIANDDVEMLKIGSLCNDDSGPWSMGVDLTGASLCPFALAVNQAARLDTLVIQNGYIYWADVGVSQLRRVRLAPNLGAPVIENYAATVNDGGLLAFAIDGDTAYLGGYDGNIEKVPLVLAMDGAPPPAPQVIAHDQPSPSSFAFATSAGRLYWTTSRCDINYLQVR
jgi:hypothetical protein